MSATLSLIPFYYYSMFVMLNTTDEVVLLKNLKCQAMSS